MTRWISRPQGTRSEPEASEDQDMPERETRAWSLATAREMVSEVRRLTAAAVEAVDALEARRGGIGRDDSSRSSRARLRGGCVRWRRSAWK
jgi:hypothetical protein